MSGFEEVAALVGSALASAGSAAGTAASSAGTGLMGALGLGGSAAATGAVPEAAASAAVPAGVGMGSGAEALIGPGGSPLATGSGAAGKTAKGGTELLGKVGTFAKDHITTKDAMDLMRLSASNRQAGFPPLPALAGGGSGKGGAQPSVQRLMQMLQQRGQPQLRLGGP